MKQLTLFIKTLAVSSLLLGLGTLALPNYAYAATEDCAPQKQLIGSEASARTCCPPGTENSATDCFFAKYITPAVNVLSVLVGVIVVLSIIAGGLQYSASGADPGKVTAAKKRISNAILALIGFLFLSALIQWLVPGGIL